MPETSTPPSSATRVAAFESRGFGLFLHWGLYSQLGAGEWVWNHHKLDQERYLQLQAGFTAADFDAPAWVALAREAGCRYVCLTTRHHEGFSLYDTRGLNTWDAPHSPAGRDLVAEFSAACDAAGMGKFFYHTTLDWWHPDFDDDWEAYQDYLRRSIDLLCSHYGRVDGFWFDGNWARRDRDWQEDRLYAIIRAKQPQAVIVNNSSHGHHGEATHAELDVVTYEQGEAKARRFVDRPRAGEVCETVNSHWGIGAADLSHKSPGTIIEQLAASRRHRANLLLNIGPEAQGGIPGYERELFRLVGRWTAIHAPMLYDAEPTALACRGRDFVLRHGDAHYYVCFNVPIQGNRHLLRGEPGDGLQSIAGALPPVGRISWLDDPDTALDFTQDGERLVFRATPFPYGRQLVVRVARLSAT